MLFESNHHATVTDTLLTSFGLVVFIEFDECVAAITFLAELNLLVVGPRRMPAPRDNFFIAGENPFAICEVCRAFCF